MNLVNCDYCGIDAQSNWDMFAHRKEHLSVWQRNDNSIIEGVIFFSLNL